jgi:hypothetical protein
MVNGRTTSLGLGCLPCLCRFRRTPGRFCLRARAMEVCGAFGMGAKASRAAVRGRGL